MNTFTEDRKTARSVESDFLKFRGRPNLFVFGVGLESGSEALQRLFNHSGNVFMFGDSGGIEEGILTTISDSLRFHSMRGNEHFGNTVQNIEANVPSLHSFRAWRPAAHWLPSMFSAFHSLIMPPGGFTGRLIGYQSGQVFRSGYYDGLRMVYPNARILFVARNPVDQWAAIKVRMARDSETEKFVRNTATHAANWRNYVTRIESLGDAEILEYNRDVESFSGYERLCNRVGVPPVSEELHGKCVGRRLAAVDMEREFFEQNRTMDLFQRLVSA